MVGVECLGYHKSLKIFFHEPVCRVHPILELVDVRTLVKEFDSQWERYQDISAGEISQGSEACGYPS